MNNCHDIEPLLTSYVLGDLDPARAGEIRKHLETCSGCRAAVQELELTLDLLRPALAVDTSTAPAHLDAQHRERLKNWRVPGFLLWLGERRQPILQWAAAAACVALISTLFIPAFSSSKKQAMRTAAMDARTAAVTGAERQDADKPAMQVAMVDAVEQEHFEAETARENEPRAKAPAPAVFGSTETASSIDDIRGVDQSDFFSRAGVPFRPAPVLNGEPRASAAPSSAAIVYEPAAEPVKESMLADLAQPEEEAGADVGAVGKLEVAGAGKKKSDMAVGGASGDALRPVSFELAHDDKNQRAGETSAAGPEYAERKRLRQQSMVASSKPVDFPGSPAIASTEGIDLEDVRQANAVAEIDGALVMKGLYAGRSSGGRGGAVGYAASYGQYTEQTVVKSLEWLKLNQNPDGSWNHAEPGVASLALLAYLAHGETTASEKYGATVEHAVRYILGQQAENGRFSADPEEHALATYAISEAYNLTRIPALKQAMDKGVAAVIDDTLAGDTSAGWFAPALRASQLAGTGATNLTKAKETLASNLKMSTEPTAARALQLLGHAKDPVAKAMVDQLTNETFNWESPRTLEQWLGIHGALFYSGGPRWTKWNSTIYKAVAQQANEDGSCPARPDSASPYKGQAASTALSALMLQTYYRFLPTFKPVATEPDKPEQTNDDVSILIEDAPQPAHSFRAYGSNPYIEVSSNRFSTFSIDVDTASYTISRNHMRRGTLPPPESVRTEEFLNFFNYGYARPDKDVFTIHTEAAPSAFGPGHLLKIGVVGRNVSARGLHKAILTLVIDTSGSMDTPDRLGLARKAVRILLDQLGMNDRVAIVQYDSQARLVLEHTAVSEKEKILAALDGLQTSGSTHLEEGLTLGYNIAAKAYKNDAINRVLFFSDGVANLGSANADEILAAVADAREKGILCSVFGFGAGTYDDTMLETLANKGDGTYQFIDSLNEAKRVFVDQLSATLDVVATDVKIQVEWNPARVARFRQLGYENRQLKTEDFRNDAVDAGEVGSSQSVTALYEMDLAGDEAAPLGTVRVRYRDAISGNVAEIEKKILSSDLQPRFDTADARFKLAACVAEFAEILRGSSFADGSTFEDVAKVLRPVALELNNDPQVQELLSLVHSASGLPRASE